MLTILVLVLVLVPVLVAILVADGNEVVGMVMVQWIPRFKSAQDQSIRDFRAVKSAYPACSKRYVFFTTDKSNV